MAIDSRYKMSQERLDTLKEELHYLGRALLRRPVGKQRV